jgi:hypothetical protein
VITDVKNIMLKIDWRAGICVSNIIERKPMITQLKVRINEERPMILRGLMNPRNHGSVLYSIPNIMTIGNSNHNSM